MKVGTIEIRRKRKFEHRFEGKMGVWRTNRYDIRTLRPESDRTMSQDVGKSKRHDVYTVTQEPEVKLGLNGNSRNDKSESRFEGEDGVKRENGRQVQLQRPRNTPDMSWDANTSKRHDVYTV